MSLSCRSRLRLGSALILGLLAVSAPADGPGPWRGVTSTQFQLLEDEKGYRLAFKGPDPAAPIPIPREWLEPAAEKALEEQEYVTRFRYSDEVHSFAVGGGRLGLHLSSYEIQEGGSARAASGRDLLLLFDPSKRSLKPGLDLGVTKGRVRLGGCFAARHHRILLGDVDGDRLLDVATIEERIACDVDEGASYEEREELARRRHNPAYSVGPAEWYLQSEAGWERDPFFDGRLPVFGFRELPLIGLVQSPVEFVLNLKRGEFVLGPGALAPPPASGLETFEVPSAGFTLRVPADWTLEVNRRADSGSITAPDATLYFRLVALEDGVTLAQQVAREHARERRLADTVKDSARYDQITGTRFRTRAGVEVHQAVFGPSPAHVARLFYAFLNPQGEIVRLDVHLHGWTESAGVWEWYDHLIRAGLALWEPEPPPAAPD